MEGLNILSYGVTSTFIEALAQIRASKNAQVSGITKTEVYLSCRWLLEYLMLGSIPKHTIKQFTALQWCFSIMASVLGGRRGATLLPG